MICRSLPFGHLLFSNPLCQAPVWVQNRQVAHYASASGQPLKRAGISPAQHALAYLSYGWGASRKKKAKGSH